MPKSAYPADSDLSALLTSTGLTVPASLDLQEKCDAAVAEWETRTGWLPYLAASGADGQPTVSTRLFDPAQPAGRGDSRSGRSLFLGAGLLSLVSLAVGVTPGPNGVYGVVPDSTGAYTPPDAAGSDTPGASGTGLSSGTVLVPNLNFFLRPQNAATRSLPVTEIEFLAPPRGVPQSIAITGVWGRVLLLEDNVWQAVMQRAASLSAPELSLSLSGGYFERKIGDSLKRFGGSDDSGPLAQQITLWDNNFNSAVKNKKRITV